MRKKAKIRNRYNQAPHLIQDTNGKVTTSQLDITNKSQEVSPFPTGDHKAPTNSCAWKHTKQIRNNINDPQKKHRLKTILYNIHHFCAEMGCTFICYYENPFLSCYLCYQLNITFRFANLFTYYHKFLYMVVKFKWHQVTFAKRDNSWVLCQDSNQPLHSWCLTKVFAMCI